jgi:hypothetical protein
LRTDNSFQDTIADRLQVGEDHRNTDKLIRSERSFAKPQNVGLIIVERDGVKTQRRQRRAQLPA